MNPSPRAFLRAHGSKWGSRLTVLLVVLVVALVAGEQFLTPDKRIVQLVAAGLVVLLAFRFRAIEGLMLTVLFLPFPKGTSYGSTNVAFVLLIFIVWLYRVSTRRASPPEGTRLDLPILALLMAYALSFYNIDSPEHLPAAFSLFAGLLTYLLLLFMVVNIVKTTEDVRKIFLIQTVSCVLLGLFAVYEQGHPGGTIVPGWIQLAASEGLRSGSVRVGSTFLDYELYGEYCVLNLFLQFFLWTRATSRTQRVVLAGIMALTFFCLFATVTRGALISFGVGSAYLIWLSRKRLNFVRLTMVLCLAIGAIAGADFIVSTFTSSGSVLARLFGTKLEGGVMPDSRAMVWSQAFGNVLEHPIIGHGPYYAARKGVEVQYWPHNVYLFYAYIVGFVGLACYLLVLWQLWRSSRPRALSLGDGTFIQGATLLTRVMLFTFIIDQIKIDYLRNNVYSFYVWFMFGMIYAVGRVADREAKGLVVEPARGEHAEARPFGARSPGVASRPAVPRVASSPAVPLS